MALRVVPAGDERCDIHNGRRPPKFICQSCANEMGIQTPGIRARVRALRRRMRHRWSGTNKWVRRGLVAAVILAIGIAVAASVVGGGGADKIENPTQEDVVNALNLSPNPDGTGWITLDGACGVVSIEVSKATVPPAGQSAAASAIATNASGTVRLFVVNQFSTSQTACVQRIRNELRARF